MDSETLSREERLIEMIHKLESTKYPSWEVINRYKGELEAVQKSRLEPPLVMGVSSGTYEQMIMASVIRSVGMPFDPNTMMSSDGDAQQFQTCAEGHRAMIKVMEYIQAQLNIDPFKGDKWAQIYFKSFVVYGRDGLMAAGRKK